MSASTRTVQQTQGIGLAGVAFMVLAVALALGAVLAIGQSTATTQIAPAAGAAPAFLDHGSRAEIGPGTAPAFVDHGSRGEFGFSANANRGYVSAASAAAANAAKTGPGSRHGLNVRRSRTAVGASTNRGSLLPN
jgi:hypothetical protein